MSKFNIPASFDVLPQTGRQSAQHNYEDALARLERIGLVLCDMRDCPQIEEVNRMSLVIDGLDRVDDVLRNMMDKQRLVLENAGGSSYEFPRMLSLADQEEATASAVAVNATPQAVVMIEERGLNIDEIPGSGKDGRVVLGDVQKFVTELGAKEAQNAESEVPEKAGSDGGGEG